MTPTADDADDGRWREHLLEREPVFDHPEFVFDDESFEREIAEVGASGAVYARDDIKTVVLGRLAGTHPISLTGGYRIEDAEVVRLSADIAQVRYTLHGQGRVTRRSTLYRLSQGRWQALHHQGTVVDGATPLPPTEPEPRHGRTAFEPMRAPLGVSTHVDCPVGAWSRRSRRCEMAER